MQIVFTFIFTYIFTYIYIYIYLLEIVPETVKNGFCRNNVKISLTDKDFPLSV